MTFHQIHLPFTHSTPSTSSYPKKAATNHTQSVVEFFAGIGLVRLGLEAAGWYVLFANDHDSAKFQAYTTHFDDAQNYHVADIHQLSATSIPHATLVTGSFPCIDLSLAGNMAGLNGKHSNAFWGLISILEAQGKQRPPLILLENVPGWLTSNKGEDFRLTIQALNSLGYICDVYALDALHFTAQSRLRIFVVGYQYGKRSPAPETLLQRPPTLANKRLKQAVLDNFDLNWGFLAAPPPPPKKTNGLSTIVEKLSNDDHQWWAENEVQRHLKMMTPTHRERVETLKHLPIDSYRTMYRRTRHGQQRTEVRRGDTAGCLRTAKGGSSRQMLIRAGRGTIKMRHMTPREYARLQGVPDSFPIGDDTLQALTNFGDAVCVPVITWIAEHILNPLVARIPHLYRERQ